MADRFHIAARTQNEPTQTDDTGGPDELMDVDDLRREAGAAAAAIMAEFANRICDAKRSTRPAELAAALKALQRARSAALAAASEHAATLMRGRRAAMENRAGRRPKIQGLAR